MTSSYNESTENTPPQPFESDATVPNSSEDRLHFGRFDLIRELGRGGFGVVFLALDTLLGRQVAIKVPQPNVLLSPALRQRIIREAQAAARLDHPHVLPVYEAGEWGVVCYVVSTYCPGESLAQWLESRSEPVAPRIAASLISKLADAVHHAHSRGVLHRDIKPANILLGPIANEDSQSSAKDDLPFVPFLMDFGLAKVFQGESDDQNQPTPLTAIIGTPGYMAPEQAFGRNDEVGPACDIYALGSVLYELLTGQSPSQDGDGGHQFLDPLGERITPPRALRSNVPRDLEAICLRCLEHEPVNRYDSAEALAKDLESFLAGIPTQARPLTMTQRAAKWVRRHPVAAILAACLAAAAVTISMGTRWHVRRIEESREALDAARLHLDAANEGRQNVERRIQLDHQKMYSESLRLATVAWQRGDTTTLHELLSLYPTAQEDDLRGFVWHYLWRQCHGDPIYLHGHENDVCFLTFSSDGTTLASASRDGSIRLWTTSTGELRSVLRGHQRGVWSVAFSPDGKTLASASEDYTVKIWEVSTGKVLQTLKRDAQSLFCVAFSPDGQNLASAGHGTQIHVWNTLTWEHERTLKNNSRNIRSLSFSCDGSTLAAGCENGTCSLWNWQDETLKADLVGHQGGVTCVSFSPDGNLLATSSRDRTLKIWNVAEFVEERTLVGHTTEANFVQFAPSGSELVSVGSAGNVRIWDLTSGQLKSVVMGHTAEALCAAYSPHGDLLVTAGADKKICVWPIQSWLDYQSVPTDSTGAGPIALAPCGQFLAIGSPNGVVRFWSFRANRDLFSIAGPKNPVMTIAFSGDGRFIGIGSEDKTVSVWDLETQRQVLCILSQDAATSCVAFSPDSKLLVTGRMDGAIQIWDMQTGLRAGELLEHSGRINELVFSPDGRHLVATGDIDEKVSVWNVANRALEYTLPGSKNWNECVAFSADGSHLAVGNKDGIVRIWNANTGQLNVELQGHRSGVLSLAFTPDGHNIAAGSADGTIKLWNLFTNQITLSLEGHAGEVTSLAFSPDSRTLVSGSAFGQNRGEVFIWHARVVPKADRLEGAFRSQ